MPELKLKQLQYEIDAWKRLLGFMSEENIHQKNRLSEILRNRFDNNLLEEFEIFHSSFLKEDEVITLLRNEVNDLDKLLLREIFDDGQIIGQVNTKFKRFRRKIKEAEEQHSKLNMDFISYLSESIIQKN